ncbi:PP2C family protein-serine/threonine phosphatase [Epibacterium sp. Ofav1-8]|uniref:PP2C family protein-serine/threonine phosphatase n=1 Tax=Epibacterium sp. Ofav1-8 TaxID=2917735 RepID=UPI001EF506A0|nr:protein phosphatase 2C domain-containing protein [Epibacterium sp. Ofav1-8]MCG7624445.1 protein phosphatase 2C domain-containing protein [Epibacterium sp. Ofav1-8]
MPPRASFSYDAATAISQGRRDRQEDSVASDFLAGSGIGFAVLADGMGGHAAGDMASKLAVTEVFAGLKLWSDAPQRLEPQIAQVLTDAADDANASIRAYASQRPDALGMGATLLAPVIVDNRLYWLSIGDSPLLLFRDGRLYRLNADHSLAAQLDRMVAAGELSAQEAHAHPDRACVTSVLTGHDIPQVDCRHAPLSLKADDLVIATSDGLLALHTAEIEETLGQGADLSSAELSQRLLARIEAANAPEQDNVAFCLIRVRQTQAPQRARPARKRRRLTVLARGNHRAGLHLHHSIRDGSA